MTNPQHIHVALVEEQVAGALHKFQFIDALTNEEISATQLQGMIFVNEYEDEYERRCLIYKAPTSISTIADAPEEAQQMLETIISLKRALKVATNRAVDLGDRLVKAGESDVNRGQFLSLIDSVHEKADNVLSKHTKTNNHD